MPKPNFGVVTFTTGVLAMLGLGAHWVQPYVPPAAENRLAVEPSEFLRRASSQRIDWRPYGPEAFAEARRTGLPILLVVGVPWGRFGRDMDRLVFTNPDLAAFISRHFVSVRGDGLQQPDLMEDFLPIMLAQAELRNEFQVWLLDPRGQVFDLALRTKGSTPGPNEFRDTLIESLQRAERGTQDAPASVITLQIADIRRLRSGSALATPDFHAYTNFLEQLEATRRGGGTLAPHAWGFLLRRGRTDLVEKWLEPLIRSPMVDWLDGGLFHAAGDGWTRVEYDKVATENADMAHVFAILGIQTGSAAYKRIALNTFDALTSEFLGPDLISACRMGEEDVNGRSARASFSPRVLRGIFPDGREREWVRDHLGLRVETNPQMSIKSERPATMGGAGATAALDRLRAAVAHQPRSFAGGDLMDVNGTVVARLLATARILGDHERLAIVARIFDHLEGFVAADDVTHSRDRRRATEPFLTDYLAYADAALQDYLATGRGASFERGLAVLRRALFLFDLGDGAFAVSYRKPGPLEPQVPPLPQVADGMSESATARMIRLLCLYGRLKPDATALVAGVRLDLRQIARMSVSHFAETAPAMGLKAGGYFRAANELIEDTYVLACGPRAQELADGVLRRTPVRFSAPVFGDVRADIQRRGAGLYVVSGKDVRGPLEIAEAVEMLSETISGFQPMPR